MGRKRIKLGFFPTPVLEMKRLSDHLGGPKLFVKRDDLTGLALGGNKTRKLEYLFAEAVASGCDSVITAGAEQSNHCRQTAAAAAVCGLECHLVLGGAEPNSLKGNLLLDNLLGAVIHWTGEYRKGEKIPEIVKNLHNSGKKPYVIPYGGSNPTGALGFVEAVRELSAQCDEYELSFSHIVFASSSGGTQAGLMVGKVLYDQRFEIIGIGIDKTDSGNNFSKKILDLANDSAKLIAEDISFVSSDATVINDYLGEGYGIVGQAEKEAIKLLAEKEGIILDPVYTAKAMAGLIAMINKRVFSQNDTVLFWHTGGTPALFT